VVASHAAVVAWVPVRAALPEDDVARDHVLLAGLLAPSRLPGPSLAPFARPWVWCEAWRTVVRMGVWEGDRRRGIRVVKMEIEVAGGGAGLIMACTSAREALVIVVTALLVDGARLGGVQGSLSTPCRLVSAQSSEDTSKSFKPRTLSTTTRTSQEST
jgi:hypothetical protein